MNQSSAHKSVKAVVGLVGGEGVCQPLQSFGELSTFPRGKGKHPQAILHMN